MFVLVHGAWHGGWCWKRVTPLLRAAGHDVFTPTLTGLGERAHLMTSSVDLETHTQDVLGVLQCEDLDRVILVGHSYGGMVITCVADRAPERLAHVVYLDAFVPRDGQSLYDLVPPERRAMYDEWARTKGEGFRLPSPPLEFFGLTDESDVRWAAPRVLPQPLATFTQPARLKGSLAGVPRTYIACAKHTGPFKPFAQRAQTEPGWRYRALAAVHDVMITAPRDLVALLLEVL
ncbi:MAG: alpha/beta fold hydrolase [Gemmatimonadales bacterium]